MSPNKPTVLLIEDDLLLAMVEERMVKMLGYNVIGTATSSEQAEEMAKKFKPEIALIDVNINGEKSGIEVAGNLSRKYSTAIIFISGHSAETVKDAIDEVNFVDFLEKPINLSSLKEPLEKAVFYNKTTSAA